MTETAHTRSRRASLGGLVLQLVAFVGALVLAMLTQSQSTFHLAWYVLGGVPIWFAALLVFRQRELAALEALDLEELRRERQTSGGGEAIFGGEGGAAMSYHVAEARLRWMQQWLIPGFGLGTALYLAAMGLYLWRRLVTGLASPTGGISGLGIGSESWPVLERVPIALVVLAILMLGTFLLSRYTSGMGRAPEWQLLRGCGSYMLGNALVIMILMICLGVWEYTRVQTWEQALAYAIPVLMVVLSLETAANFVMDIYRPRLPGVEPRACFDSRLLGLMAEPGGIASSIAEALNYQFGFQVSQTWFYQLLERTFVPLLGVGAAALWLLTCVVVVQPYEHVVIERFGRQLNAGGTAAAAPLGPGLHFKRPWPLEVARVYNTGQLHQISVGFSQWDAVPKYEEAMKQVQLWTDTTHLGLEHFDFPICPTPEDKSGRAEALPATQPVAGESSGQAYPVHLIRMEVEIQYRIAPDKLDRFTQAMVDPHRAMRDIAWEEVSRLNASSTIDILMGKELSNIGQGLHELIGARVANVGLDVVHVGVTNVHPENNVAQAYREVIGAEQQKVAAIREARVTESQRLSAVAGDASRAQRLAKMTVRAREASERLNAAMGLLAGVDQAAVAELAGKLREHAALFAAEASAAARQEDATEREKQVEEDYALGLGQTLVALRASKAEAAEARVQYETAKMALDTAVEPLRAAPTTLSVAGVEQVVQSVSAESAQNHWDRELEREYGRPDLGGEAAVKLATALADRWELEMGAASEVARVENEREAYRVAPEVYKSRRLIEVLVDGLKDARKFFLAFEPRGRTVRVRFVTEDQPGTDVLDWGRPGKPKE